VIRKPNRISENRNREGEVSQEKSPSRFLCSSLMSLGPPWPSLLLC
jgi:hypothetical protein